MPHPPAQRRARSRTRTGPGRRLVAEVTLGLVAGVLGGWVAGLVRVRRP